MTIAQSTGCIPLGRPVPSVEQPQRDHGQDLHNEDLDGHPLDACSALGIGFEIGVDQVLSHRPDPDPGAQAK